MSSTDDDYQEEPVPPAVVETVPVIKSQPDPITNQGMVCTPQGCSVPTQTYNVPTQTFGSQFRRNRRRP